MTSAEDLSRLLTLYKREIGHVNEALSPHDMMWDGNEAHYRQVGESAVRCVRLALLAAGKPAEEVREVLDLPCGHGRVLRYLQQLLPAARFTACDLDRDGVDFCASSFGALPLYSDQDPAKIAFPTGYDLIWCGSLLTHLDAPMWSEFLAAFASALRPGGVLVFTTVGATVPPRIARGWDYGLPVDRLRTLVDSFRRDGFGFVEYVNKKATGRYGLSLARPDWTVARVGERQELSLLYYREWAWDDHQDAVACIKARPEPSIGPAAEKLAGFR